MTSLGSALLDALSEDDLDALAAKLASRLASRLGGAEAGDGWLNSTQAAAHIGAPRSRVHDLVAMGRLRPSRDGRRLVFARAELDRYMQECR